jgi:hypothetical protein
MENGYKSAIDLADYFLKWEIIGDLTQPFLERIPLWRLSEAETQKRE